MLVIYGILEKYEILIYLVILKKRYLNSSAIQSSSNECTNRFSTSLKTFQYFHPLLLQ